MRIPRICPAAFCASSGVPASLMPPALPRLPVGTCALITQGPIFAAAIAASDALMHRIARGTGIPAGVRISDFAACSSKFIARRNPRLLAVFLPIIAEQGFLARLVFRDGGDQVGDIEKVPVVQIIRNTVAAP